MSFCDTDLLDLFDKSLSVEDAQLFPVYFQSTFGYKTTHSLFNLGYAYSLTPNDPKNWFFEINQDHEDPFVWYVVGNFNTDSSEDEKSLRFRYQNGSWIYTTWYP